jgi:threonine synthase
VVCIVTGHGFKDLDSVQSVARENTVATITEGEIDPQLLEVNG